MSKIPSNSDKATRTVTWIIVSLAVLYFAMKMAVPHHSPKEGPNFTRFGSIPVLKSGRIKPLDTLARNQLLAINGKGEVALNELENLPPGAKVSRGKATLSNNAWLAEMLFDGRAAATRPVLLVENEEVKALFNQQESGEKRFSPAQVLSASHKISDLANQARSKNKEELTVFDKQIVALDLKIQQFIATSATIQPPGETNYSATMTNLPALLAKVAEIARSVPDINSIQSGEGLSDEQKTAINAGGRYISMMQQLNNANHTIAIRPLPPLVGEGKLEDWRKFGDAALSPERNAEHPDEALLAWAKISDGYRAINDDNGAAFNQAVDAYLAYLDDKNFTGLGKSKVEFWFNGWAPFTSTLPFYLFAGLLVLASWIVWTKPLSNTAYRLLTVLFLVHTLGIILRIYLSGRPPVTNLYSSAVFIGWGAIGASLVLERWALKNGIGSFVASVIGCATLIIALQLSFDGDTMEVKQAVLDSNFWLSTHVIIITLGYSATFLAGLLALVWALASLFVRKLEKSTEKSLYSSTFGVICFAMLFSFVGTVLGGIWADQSWGRFWGWDPKENGALLIVLWNAIILHCRWGGICKTRGFMALAILGIAITSWSWFGTNLLGVGLHSYGFREGALVALGQTCTGIALIALATLIFVPAKPKADTKEA